MKYKVGDEVVLSDKKGVKEEFKGKAAEIVEPPRMVSLMSKDYAFKVEGRSRTAYGSDDDIDHEKTAELRTDRVAKHYINDLEKVVAEKNKVDMPVDNIKPSHYRKGEIDLIELWYQTMPFDGFRWAMKSHIDKYIHRYESKGGIEDLDKATYFIKRLKEKELEQC